MTTKERAVAIVLQGDRVLVIRRDRDGHSYTVLPGGGIEPREQPATAVVRELAEETGLVGTVVAQLATIAHDDRTAHYFALSAAPGELHLGGPELDKQSESNRYTRTGCR